MAYSARNWGFTPHNNSMVSALKNMILSYSYQISALQQDAYNGYASPDVMERVLSLSKARAYKLYQEDALKAFMSKFLSGEAVSFEEVADFLRRLVFENPYIDDQIVKPASVEFREFHNDNRGQYVSMTKGISINKKYIVELVNSTASVEERFKMLHRIIVTVGHENTHFYQDKLNSEYQYSDALDYIGFVGEQKVKGWDFLKKFADTSDIDDETLQGLSGYIYSNSPHEIDARLGGIVFANHVLRELAARFYHDKDFNNFEENYSTFMTINSLREHIRLDSIIDEMAVHDEWDARHDGSKWLGDVLSRVDVKKLAKLGIDLQDLILGSKNRDINDYNQFSKEIANTFYNYNSLLQFICMASDNDDNFNTRLLRQFIIDGNISSELILNNLLNIQKRNALDVNFDIGLILLLKSDEVTIASFQRSDCLRAGKPLLLPQQRKNLTIDLINQDKFQYVFYILPPVETLVADNYIHEVVHNKIMEYSQRVQAQDITLYPEHFYALGHLAELCRMQEDVAYLSQFIPLAEQLEQKMHPLQIRQNHARVYGQKASDFYYDKYQYGYTLTQEEAANICNEVDELTR